MNLAATDWKTATIGELGKVITGGTPSTKQQRFYGETYPFITPTDIDSSCRFIRTERCLSEEGRGNQSNRLLPPGAVCFVCIGATIGKMCMTDRPSFTNQQINSIVVDRDKYDNTFLYYLLCTKVEQIKSIAGGAATPIVNKTSFSNVQVKVPPLTTQHKIASILSAYDDLIENNTRRIQILEAMAQMLYREWFVNFRFPGHEQVKMVKSDLGRIPEGWEVKNLPDLCSRVIDGTHDSPKPVEEGYPLVTGRHIINGFIDFTRCYFISSEEHKKVMKRSKPERGDIIFSNIGTLGSTTIVDQKFEFSIKNVALFKPAKDLYSKYLYLYFSLTENLASMVKKASGTSQKFFSLQFLRELSLSVPGDDIFSMFDRIVGPIIEQRSLLNNKNTNLRRTRDLLLPKLISGEIDVEALDIDVGTEAYAD